MRLLRYSKENGLHLEESGDDCPPYAILSHTWGKDEVSLQDMVSGTGRNKSGYFKIQFCGEQAYRDGLEYFWVDSCCIDRSSSSELQEAINCMFQWYQKARRCYVYLEDVCQSLNKAGTAISSWERDFAASRWFTRGWTLQELLAPKLVDFFSKEGHFLGNKISLERIIHETTKIPSTALQGKPLSEFSVAERMSWMESRNTTRKEDMAYSLLGLFDIFMPLLYGEGRERALRRLQEEIDRSLGRATSQAERGRSIYVGNSAADRAGMINGDIGVSNQQRKTYSVYKRNEARDSSFQVNGSINPAAFQAFITSITGKTCC